MQVTSVQDVRRQFNETDKIIKSVFPKVDPLLVVGLIFAENERNEGLYTLEIRVKEGQDTNAIREHIIRETGMAPGFYLGGTKIIVTQKLDLEILKTINDFEEVMAIKGSPYGAGGATNF